MGLEYGCRGSSGERWGGHASLHERIVARVLEDHGSSAIGRPRFRRPRSREKADRGNREPGVRNAFLWKPESHRPAYRFRHWAGVEAGARDQWGGGELAI